MPLNIDIVQILLHMLNFVILAGGLTFLLFKPVCKFLNERREYYEKLDKENAELAANNEKLKEEYEKKLADAEAEFAALRAAAEKESTDAAKDCIESARERAAEIITAAESEAEKRKLSILESTQTEINEIVLEATQKLLCNTASEERTRALFDEFIRTADLLEPDKRAAE